MGLGFKLTAGFRVTVTVRRRYGPGRDPDLAGSARDTVTVPKAVGDELNHSASGSAFKLLSSK